MYYKIYDRFFTMKTLLVTAAFDILKINHDFADDAAKNT